MSKDKQVYSNKWKASSDLFKNNGSYRWMSDKLSNYATVLEIGSGTGQSTITLLEQGHKVICVEKNIYCLEKAKLLLENNGYRVGCDGSDFRNIDAILINADVCDSQLMSYLSKTSFDVVICWNVGSYWNREMVEYYIPHIAEYGFTTQEFESNSKSLYAELIIWKCCEIARKKDVPIHIVDRNSEMITDQNDEYYNALKTDFNYSKISYDNKKSISLNRSGIPLTSLQCNDDIIEIYLVSILIE